MSEPILLFVQGECTEKRLFRTFKTSLKVVESYYKG